MTVTCEAIDLAFSPRHHPEVTTVELDDEAVLYDERTGVAHVLNGTAAVVWSCFDGSVSLGELVAELAEAYAVPAATIEEDVLSLARRLGGQGLLDGVTGEARDPDQPVTETQEADDCADE